MVNYYCSFSHPHMMTESFRASPLDLPDAPRARAEIVPGTESHLALAPTEVIKVKPHKQWGDKTILLYFQVNADVHHHHPSEAEQREEKCDSDQSDNTESDEWTYL